MSDATNLAPARRQWRSRTTAAFWWVSAVGLMVFSGYLGRATAGEVRAVMRVVPPKPPEVMGDVVIKNVTDLLGRRASFRILLFSDEFRWRLNSSEVLENGPVRPDFTPEMKTVLNDAQEIICVGASSEEIPAGVSFDQGRVEEEQRAARRAERIALWIRRAVSRPIPIRKLNIGHHALTGRPQDTSDQRRVVIIIVLDRDDSTNVDQALRSAMTRESSRAPIFKTLLSQYSLSAGDTFTWVR